MVQFWYQDMGNYGLYQGCNVSIKIHGKHFKIRRKKSVSIDLTF